ncbi:uncharacterized protein Z518_04643 [Rhinocladiella mackenziei CBS 650.93]|uniref:Rhinocladiella mackenziei CBS 650.93 unplaced genomic scaffold supercont1.3, whole genome shotgun sequence n=1 Tax=Rhinocladiella mackenziei CBS 650.93 TaxID=1442369 RepID=A0A0D2FWP1_9EURO|nr:uncharacterized protein Z518_04643 [Rhinocladiella mackenziei CBS 650.93]KIX06667.1 hypothetical protein Z518_04643 [Rhinocladiella mackenziei CBS 650.93]
MQHAEIDHQKLMQTVFRVPLKSAPRDLGISPTTKTAFHARKSHKKSRTGCKTCKQRRIKCDENKDGGCLKCQSHGLDCDYNRDQLSIKGNLILPRGEEHGLLSSGSNDSSAGALVKINHMRSLTPLRPGLNPIFPCTDELPDRMTPIFQTLHHFDTVTYCSMGSDMGQQIIRYSMYNIVLEKPYLMHAINGISAAHLCHLLPAAQHPIQHKQNKLADAYHWQKALRLFRNEIASGANKQNMDALLSTIMLICVHQFMLADPMPDPSKSFVYAPSEKRDEYMKWLTIQHGFQALWLELGETLWESIWSPVLRDSDLKPVAPLFLDVPEGDEEHALFLELCEVTKETSREENPFYTPLEYLLFLRLLRPSMNIFNKLITFVGVIDDRFYNLLRIREKRALIILAHWLARMSEIQQWWISGRSRTECIAIITFLMYDQDERIRRLLAYPAKSVGLPLV